MPSDTMPDTLADPAIQPLRQCYRAAATFLRDLEREAETCGEDLSSAKRLFAIVTNHIDPLRDAIEAVERDEDARMRHPFGETGEGK